MSQNETPAAGTIVWTDLSVPNASVVRDFYSQVIGWESSAESMGNTRITI